MHELGITRNIVSIVADAAGSNPVARVSVKIGEFSAVLPDALHFCFDSCTRGTVLENARLEIINVPGRLACSDCGIEFGSSTPFGRCQCGSRNLRCVAGDELLVHEMELQ
ncbi:hydrogenase maturation nickel metallochaperone HypA [Litorivivens sp.]|uniref:hydrogenase maturation nickel metallochaperone HypA/HybF n=1 Tax=Litorivivens sp. TaxID=2020868 RepID=UPI003566FBEC